MKKEPLPVPGPWEVRQLGREFLPVVVGHYHSYPNPKYLGERLDAGVMHGAFEGEELLGFIGMHSEGSVGLLEVLPAHRRRGGGLRAVGLYDQLVPGERLDALFPDL